VKVLVPTQIPHDKPDARDIQPRHCGRAGSHEEDKPDRQGFFSFFARQATRMPTYIQLHTNQSFLHITWHNYLFVTSFQTRY
jgi:hypothetical protein